ncbi:MAG: YceI family protein [Alphaproteobacteria bacterium]|jgi:polyisoprenoid-binding protein YceI|nr:YceI family protein [Alphaproteobacteria bacterium]MDP7222270.1 YceI family protein [Alphaproteobacteria bacterium]
MKTPLIKAARHMAFIAMGVAFLLSATTPAKAEAAKYNFDKAHTQILFFVNHLGFSNSQGEFHDYDGHFTFDPENPAASSVDVAIKTASIDMDDAAWDKHLKNEDFFHVEKFPNMTFKSTAIEVTGENTAKITGDLTLLGVTHPVTLDVTHNKSGTHPYSGKFVSGFSATTTIKRSAFGMKYGLPAVSDDVEVRLEVEGIRQEAAQEAETDAKADSTDAE